MWKKKANVWIYFITPTLLAQDFIQLCKFPHNQPEVAEGQILQPKHVISYTFFHKIFCFGKLQNVPDLKFQLCLTLADSFCPGTVSDH